MGKECNDDTTASPALRGVEFCFNISLLYLFVRIICKSAVIIFVSFDRCKNI